MPEVGQGGRQGLMVGALRWMHAVVFDHVEVWRGGEAKGGVVTRETGRCASTVV